jgi:methionyl-tRNA synthetase
MNLKPTYAVTTPLFYPNSKPHMGSAYPAIAADAIARHHRQRGKEVLMITGTDEHGQKMKQAAQLHGLLPQNHCDKMAVEFSKLWQQLNVQHDRFIRTTSSQHEAIVLEFFQRVEAAGDIYLGTQQGWYCTECEEYKSEKDLLPDRVCPIHTNRSCEWRDEPNYFFRLSAYQQKLEEFHNLHPDFIQPESRRNEVVNFIAQGLRDFSISRVNLDWGIALPTDPTHSLYVWFDALLGYITALLESDDEPTLANATAKFYPIDLHIVGKDILRFHTVYWPAMLMSAGLPLPQKVFGHGFLTKDGQKMGKSLGNIIDPVDLSDRFGADAVRYYFMKEIGFGKDSDFSENRFIEVLNTDLANGLGNLLSRSVNMLHQYCNGKVPTLKLAEIPANHVLKAIGKDLIDRIPDLYEQVAITAACRECLSLIDRSNRYITEQAPWELIKTGDRQQVDEILYSVLESLRLYAYLMYPVVPTLTSKIYTHLGYPADYCDRAAFFTWQDAAWGLLPCGQILPRANPIFQRIVMPRSDNLTELPG